MSNKVQVGGNHYQLPIQPIEYINANDLAYCEGNIVKYATRHKSKNREEDVLKIIHYALFILRDEYGIIDDDDLNKAMGAIKK